MPVRIISFRHNAGGAYASCAGATKMQGKPQKKAKNAVYHRVFGIKDEFWSFAVFAGEIGEGFGIPLEPFAAYHLLGIQ